MTRSPCSLKMYMSARPSKGPQVGKFVPGLDGNDIKEQLTLFSAIICITVFRQPDLKEETQFASYFERFLLKDFCVEIPSVRLLAWEREGFGGAGD